MSTNSLLESLDTKPSQFTLSYKSKTEYRSNIGGIIGLCYILLYITIFCFKAYRLLQRDHIYVNSNVIIADDIQPLDISSGKFRLALFQLTSQTQESIKFSQLAQKGLHVYIKEQNFSRAQDESEIYKYKNHEVVQCTEGHYKQTYNICIPKDLDMFILGRYDFFINNTNITLYRRISFIVEECQIQTSPGCKNISQDPQFVFVFAFNNNLINETAVLEQNIIKQQSKYRGIQSEVSMKKRNKIVEKIDFKRAQIQTYESLWPQIFLRQNPKFIQKWFYEEEHFQSFQSTGQDFPHKFLQITLERSVYTHLYTRWFDKFDTLLAEMAGIMGLLGAILYFLYSGYNDWSFEQILRKQMGYRYKEPNIFTFYKIKIMKICKCLRKSQKDLLMNSEVEQENQKFREQLDYYILLKKMKEKQKQSRKTKNSIKIQKATQNRLTIPQADQNLLTIPQADNQVDPEQEATQTKLLLNQQIN